jgi:Fe2+ or Zn2+ uptake regulation protein
MTKNYRLVYDIVREQTRGAHLAPADVFTLAKKKRQGIGFTTVYRALARLRDLGLVSEISVPGAESSYYETAGPAHAHFRCEGCGAIEDIDYAIDSSIVNEIARKHGIAVRDVSLSLHGKCRRCTDRVESPAG